MDRLAKHRNQREAKKSALLFTSRNKHAFKKKPLGRTGREAKGKLAASAAQQASEGGDDLPAGGGGSARGKCES